MSGEQNGTEAAEVSDFNSIVWRGGAALKDAEMWERNRGVMRMLFQAGTPSGFIENDYSPKIPKEYTVDGIKIEFLPHWGFYKVSGLALDVPASEEDIGKDVEAAQYLLSRGQRDITK